MLLWKIGLACAMVFGDPRVIGAFGPTSRAMVLDRAGRIHGTVTNERGVGVAAVELRLVPSDHATTAQAAVSDSTGHFSFSDLPAGSYQLTARRLGYQPVDVAVTVKDDVDQLIDLRMSTAPQRLDTVSIVGKSLTPARYGTSSRMD